MKKSLCLICTCLACSMAAAQTPDTVAPTTVSALPASLRVKAIPSEISDKPSFRKNNVKINLSSLALKNYNFSYERSLSRKISFMAGYRFMPATPLNGLPLVEKLEDKDVLTQGDLDNWSAANKTFTGEFRFYGGRKPGARGFYLSLYGRYTSMQVDYLYDYESYNDDTNSSKTYQIPLKNDLKGLGGGLMIGAQWLIAKRVVLDWYILGGHYGNLTGNVDAAVDLSDMSAAEKAELRQDLESFEVAGMGLISEATVTDEGVQAIVDGPFLGIRGAGISLGVAF